MNALSSRQLSSVFSLACRTTGIIMILATIFSMVLLPWPYQLQDRDWLLFQFITPVVDRGIIALLGVVLLLASAWVDGIAADKQGNSGKGGVAFGSFIVSVIFSIFFLLMLAAFLINLFQWRTGQLTEVADQARQATEQLEQQVDQQITSIETLLENTGLRQDAIAQGQVPAEIVALLEQLDQNPEGIVTLQEDSQDRLSTTKQEIGVRRQELEKEVSDRVLKSGLMTGLDSLLLALGFGVISWTGLRLSK